MDTLAHAIEIVRRAEGEVRELLVQSAGQSDYDNAGLLADLASELHHISQQLGCGTRLSHATSDRREQPLVRSTSNTPRTREKSISKSVGARRKKRKAGVGGNDYPRFLLDGDELVKVGWSKRRKAVYRHKAPKRVVMLVVQALRQAGGNGERFVMEEVLPLPDPENQADVPSYQAYLVLAWLREENLIVRHGRQGYSLPPNTDLVATVERCWGNLPTLETS